ncbi:hypothetical protein HELRODRAFT_168956 [Helobdella robusta]|uniref:Uncharacterized protein n=1 Tax=Helobdella robusta TaxID=6412 RepID=T1F171_HELRO|nr:hypothetical protein HELRODRAFT_168956 [Helobdella robusta]ESO09024.1 hypothetical protein HELRODRAFT_168956 [Helobdella robusta]
METSSLSLYDSRNDYSDEICRLKTFLLAPKHIHLVQYKLSANGFYFTGRNNLIKNYFSSNVLPFEENSKVSDHQFSVEFQQAQAKHRNGEPDDIRYTRKDIPTIYGSGNNFMDENVRLRSFVLAPPHLFKLRDGLVRMRFYYTGDGSKLKCSSCSYVVSVGDQSASASMVADLKHECRYVR